MEPKGGEFFQRYKAAERENPDTPFSGKYIDYEINLRK